MHLRGVRSHSMKTRSVISRFIDIRFGIAGGVVMGLIVFFINYNITDDVGGSLTASLKQGIYTFFFGGVIMKLCEQIAIRMNPAFLAILLSMVIPSVVSLALTYGVHSLRGTPMPLESTVPTAIFVIPSTLVWGYISRKRARKQVPGEQT